MSGSPERGGAHRSAPKRRLLQADHRLTRPGTPEPEGLGPRGLLGPAIQCDSAPAQQANKHLGIGGHDRGELKWVTLDEGAGTHERTGLTGVKTVALAAE